VKHFPDFARKAGFKIVFASSNVTSSVKPPSGIEGATV
jgi:hypothetical protein